ncbi:MAG: HAD-IC family P-type ATPase, partial [Thiohalorhabdaceae bacterium]
MVPTMARRLEGDGTTAWVPVGELQSGDRVRVVPGEAVPVDGTVAEGHSALDESALTGEYTPVHRGPGDPVLGGATNGEGPLTVAVERVGEETFVSGILRLLEEAQAARPRIARRAEQASRWFVWGLLAVAATVGGIWWAIEPERAFWIVVALLIVTCPCALALATPTALVVATGELAKRGVLVARGEALETLGQVDRRPAAPGRVARPRKRPFAGGGPGDGFRAPGGPGPDGRGRRRRPERGRRPGKLSGAGGEGAPGRPDPLGRRLGLGPPTGRGAADGSCRS